jgi:hypothetical protein
MLLHPIAGQAFKIQALKLIIDSLIGTTITQADYCIKDKSLTQRL